MLIAYSETGYGFAVMSNGDNSGTLNMEILRSISKAYGWPNFKPQEKTTIKVDPAKFKSMVGLYTIKIG